MYICRVCSFSTNSPYSYIKHCRVHSQEQLIPCGVASCNRQCKSLSAFSSHLSRDHSMIRFKNRRNLLQNTGITVMCQVSSCKQSLAFTTLVKHLQGHIASGIAILCPVVGCGRKMSNRSTFSAHLSVKHGGLSKLNVDKNLISDAANDCGMSTIDATDNDDDTNLAALAHVEADAVMNFEPIDSSAFVRNLALFFLKLQCRHHIASSTIQIVANELRNLHELSAENTYSSVKSKLLLAGMADDKVCEVMLDIQRNDIFDLALNQKDGLLRSHHKRNCFYRDKFHYVEPVQIALGYNSSNKACFYHYIPLAETVNSLLKDHSVQHCIKFVQKSKNDVYADLHDGHVYKSIAMSVGDAKLIEIILYQDAFELVNPLGSAKKVHKLLAFYLVLANLPNHLRMKMDNIQLVLLCRETDINFFGPNKVLNRLMNDLKFLESNGLHVNDQFYQIRLLCVLGDNLGSHWLDGFSMNFSTNRFFCRYCLVERQVNDPSSLSTTCELRTPDTYEADVVLATSEVISRGVMKQSVFNSLDFFHVCMPGLPPCLGHDVFEGVLQFDLALCLKKMSLISNQNHMSYDHLNRSIKMFKFLGTDACDKPGVVSSGPTVGGHAIQNWCLLRLLPFLLFDVIDTSCGAWKLLLLLREIVELVCAPKISKAQIFYLNRLLKLYMEDRLLLFPKVALRPKHHYLLHYPWLITMFGPLIHVWTMRLESKHGFFKQCVRSAHNFINVTKTLSETHQLNQALISTGMLVCEQSKIGHDCIPFDKNLFAESIVRAVSLCSHLSPPLFCSSAVTVKGSVYRKSSFVVIAYKESRPLFGKVLLCITGNNDSCGLVLAVCEASKNQDLGLYMLTGIEQGDSLCVFIDDLWDYCPLSAYDINGIPHIALKHAIFDNGVE